MESKLKRFAYTPLAARARWSLEREQHTHLEECLGEVNCAYSRTPLNYDKTSWTFVCDSFRSHKELLDLSYMIVVSPRTSSGHQL